MSDLTFEAIFIVARSSLGPLPSCWIFSPYKIWVLIQGIHHQNPSPFCSDVTYGSPLTLYLPFRRWARRGTLQAVPATLERGSPRIGKVPWEHSQANSALVYEWALSCFHSSQGINGQQAVDFSEKEGSSGRKWSSTAMPGRTSRQCLRTTGPSKSGLWLWVQGYPLHGSVVLSRKNWTIYWQILTLKGLSKGWTNTQIEPFSGFLCKWIREWKMELINFIRRLKKVLLLPDRGRPRFHPWPHFDRGHHQKANAGGQKRVAIEKVHFSSKTLLEKVWTCFVWCRTVFDFDSLQWTRADDIDKACEVHNFEDIISLAEKKVRNETFIIHHRPFIGQQFVPEETYPKYIYIRHR